MAGISSPFLSDLSALLLLFAFFAVLGMELGTLLKVHILLHGSAPETVLFLIHTQSFLFF
jgi:hypothetical protein